MKDTVGIILYLWWTIKSQQTFTFRILHPFTPSSSSTALPFHCLCFQSHVLSFQLACTLIWFMSPCLLLSDSLKCDQVSFVLAAETCRGVGRGREPPFSPSYEQCFWVQLLSELLALQIQLFWHCLNWSFAEVPVLLLTTSCGNRLCFNVLLTGSSKQVSQLA